MNAHTHKHTYEAHSNFALLLSEGLQGPSETPYCVSLFSPCDLIAAVH